MSYNRAYKTEPDWEKIKSRERLAIVKGQTANQLWSMLVEKAACEEAEFPAFSEVLKTYEETFPRLLEVNKKLLLGGDSYEA